MKLLFSWLLLALPAAAQRPTAEAARPGATFWPLEPRAGQVVFAGPLAQPTAPALVQAERARACLTQVGADWTELRVAADSVQYFSAQLPGRHPGVALRFLLRLSQRPAGWTYQLLRLEVRSPTGSPDVVHWLPLARVLNDRDWQAEVQGFQQRLQQALPRL